MDELPSKAAQGLSSTPIALGGFPGSAARVANPPVGSAITVPGGAGIAITVGNKEPSIRLTRTAKAVEHTSGVAILHAYGVGDGLAGAFEVGVGGVPVSGDWLAIRLFSVCAPHATSNTTMKSPMTSRLFRVLPWWLTWPIRLIY